MDGHCTDGHRRSGTAGAGWRVRPTNVDVCRRIPNNAIRVTITVTVTPGRLRPEIPPGLGDRTHRGYNNGLSQERNKVLIYHTKHEASGVSMRLMAALILFCALAGCAGDVTSYARLTDAMTNYNNQDDNECRFQGTTAGTDPYFQCRDALAQARIAEADAAKEAQRQAAANPPTPQQPYQQR